MTPIVADKARRATALPPGERRAAIVAAVLPLVVEHGSRVTTKQIADAAGIAEGTIFRVFSDKDELLAAVLDAALDTESFEAELERIDPTEPFEGRLVEATRIIQQRVVNVFSVYSAISPSHLRTRPGPPADSPALIALFAAEADRLRVAPTDAARSLRALTLSLTHPLFVSTPSSPDTIVDVVLHGIGHGIGHEIGHGIRHGIGTRA